MKTLLLISFLLLLIPIAYVSAAEVAFVGDLGTKTSGKTTIQAIKTEKPDLAVILGDMGYSSSSKSFASQVKILRDAGIPVYCLIGNHDAAEEESSKLEKEYFKLCADGDGFFNVKLGNLTVIGLNTQRSLKTSTSFLKTVEPNTFAITTSHKSLCESPKSKHGAIKCDTAFNNELKRLDVDADIGGHNHLLAFDGKGNFVSGAGGRSHYSGSGWSFINDDDYGYLLLTVGKQLDFIFKNQKGKEISPHFTN